MKLSSFNSFDGTNLKYYSWLTENPVGTVVVFHGMAEYGARYKSFANFLNKNGYDVYLMDFRGHGNNIGQMQGYFADKNGWDIVVNDMKSFVDYVFDHASSKKVILFGHSMGSLLLRSYLIKICDSRISKFVISGTPATPSKGIFTVAMVLSGIVVALGGKRKPSKLMDKMAFGQYAKSIKNPNTTFDWLSHDRNAVMKYIADPLCGFICTGGFFKDLLYGMKYCNLSSNLVQTDSKIKLLILSGDEDPVGDFGKAPQMLSQELSSVLEKGNVSIKIYRGYRHEILNEVD